MTSESCVYHLIILLSFHSDEMEASLLTRIYAMKKSQLSKASVCLHEYRILCTSESILDEMFTHHKIVRNSMQS